jgi:hypothetical protein
MSVKRSLLFTGLSAICIAAVLGFGYGGDPQEQNPEIADDQILAVAMNASFLDEFITEDCRYEITVLHPDNLTKLSKEYPVIYGDLPEKTLHRIDYTNGRGMLVIVDMENKMVLRHFMTSGVNLE